MDDVQVINDGVMGGRSTSRVSPTATGLLFEGDVSLENGGGFASFRAPLHLPPDTTAIRFNVRGDGRRYRFVLRTDDRPGAAQYHAPFVAPPGQTALRFESADFTARWRGRTVPTAPPLRFSDVKACGLLIGDGQSGPFRVELEWPRAG